MATVDINADQGHEDEENERHDKGEQHEQRDSEAEIDDSSFTKSETSASEVWKYFTKDPDFKQNKKAKCDICGITYIYSGGNRTSNLLRHIDKKHLGKQNQELKITDIFNVSAKWKYDNNEMQDKLIKWIVINQHPFTITEEPNFIDFVKSLCPNATLFSADTVKRKIMDFYISDMEKCKIFLKKFLENFHLQ